MTTARIAALLALRYALVAVVASAAWLSIGGPPVPLVALPLHYYSPAAYSATLLLYATLSPAWGSLPTPTAFIVALIAAAIPSPREKTGFNVKSFAWLLPYASIYIVALLASLYAYLVAWRLLTAWSYAPPAVRLVLEYLTSSRLFVIGVMALVAVVLLHVTVSLFAPLVYALSSSRAARRLATGELEGEASKIARLRAWYHKVFTSSLSMLVALPVALIVNSLIAVIYSRLEAIAPPGTRETLVFVRGAISMVAFFATTRIVSKSITAWLSGGSLGYTRPLHVLMALVFVVVTSILVTLDPLYPLKSIACITGCDPGVTSLDYRVGGFAREAGAWLEESEQLLRFLVKLLWS